MFGKFSFNILFIPFIFYAPDIHEKETTFKRHRFDGSCVCRLPRMPSEVQTESDNIE